MRRMIFAVLVEKEERVEVKFYDQMIYENEYQTGQGYVSTLPGSTDVKQNPIGFHWKLETPTTIIQESNVH